MVDDEERSVNDATHTSRLLLSVKFQLEKTNGSTHITLLRLNLMFLLASCVLDTLSLFLFIGSISGGKCVVFEDRHHSGTFLFGESFKAGMRWIFEDPLHSLPALTPSHNLQSKQLHRPTHSNYYINNHVRRRHSI